MSESEANHARRELAVGFLLALAVAGPLLLLGWGRAYGLRATAADTAPSPAPESGPLPAEFRRWEGEVGQQAASQAMGAFFDALEALSEGAQPPEVEGDAAALTAVTVYAPPSEKFRTLIRDTGPIGAAVAAARRLHRKYEGQVAADNLRVRLDVLRESRPFPLRKRLEFAEGRMVKPVGIALKHGGEAHYFLPADIVDYGAATQRDMLHSVCRRAGLAPTAWQAERLRMWRLEVEGYVNSAKGSRRALASHRGLTPPHAVNAATLLRADRLAADFLVRARGADGLFFTFWNPASNLKGGCDSITEAASAAAALARFCELRPDEKYVRACREVLAAVMQHTDMDPAGLPMALTTREEPCRDVKELAASARTLEAMCRFRRISGHEEPDPWIEALGAFLLFMQRRDGTFYVQYETENQTRSPAQDTGRDLASAAAAVQALVLAHETVDRPDFLVAAQEGLRAIVAAEPEPGELSARQARALLGAVREFTRFVAVPEFTDFALEVARERRRRQLTAAETPAADFVGGTVQSLPPEAGDTADDLGVFAAARFLGDGESAAAAERAAGYLLGLQFLPENSYYLSDPEEAAGGVREQPTSNLVRVTTMDSVLRGLTQLVEVKLAGDE